MLYRRGRFTAQHIVFRMRSVKSTPNPAGRAGKPIVLPPTTFEVAVKKALNTPAPKEDKPKKKSSKKR